MSSPHGIRLEGCQRSFRGEVLQLLHVLNSAVDSFQGESLKSAAPNNQH